jgi:AcrR family transcriptional regulator
MARPKMETERKAQILDALERIVLRDGLAKLTLAKVAEEAGFPRSLLRYFAGNKIDLVLLLFDRMIERGEAKLEQLEQVKQGSLSARQLVDLVLDELLGDEDLSLMVDELWPYAALDERIQERLRGLYQRLCHELSNLMAADGIGNSDQDRERRAYGIVSMGFGATFFADIGFMPSDPKAVRKAAHQLLLSDGTD